MSLEEPAASMSLEDSTPTSPPKGDANDYSRFDEVNDSDDDTETKADSSSTKDETLPLHEAISKASAMKGRSNYAIAATHFRLHSVKLSYKNLPHPPPLRFGQ